MCTGHNENKTYIQNSEHIAESWNVAEWNSFRNKNELWDLFQAICHMIYLKQNKERGDGNAEISVGS